MKQDKRRILIFLSIVFVMVFSFSIYAYKFIYLESDFIKHRNTRELVLRKEVHGEEKDKLENIRILAVGDIMVHTPQLAAQKTASGYDFTNNFTHVKEYIENADIKIANLETTLAGPGRKYDGYPMFNSPDELVDALKYAGFNVLSIVNNHTLDTKSAGFLRTMSVLKEKGVPFIGARQTVEEKRYTILDVKGIKVGLIAYTYEIPVNGLVSLNGNIMQEDVKELINYFDYYDLPTYFEKMGEEIDNMRNDGAEIIVFFLHFGNEYELNPNTYQREIAEFLASKEVQIVFGSHPHIMQPFDTLGDTVVFYSLGNFLSNQRYEAMERRDTEDGIIAEISYEKNFTKNTLSYKASSLIPTWVNKYRSGGKYVYEIIPLLTDENGILKEELDFKDNKMRAEGSLKATASLIRRSNVKNVNLVK